MNNTTLKNRIHLTGQARLIAQVVGFALLTTAVRIIVAIATQYDWVATSSLLTVFILGLASFLVARRHKLRILSAGLSGYFYLWATLLTINSRLVGEFSGDIISLISLLFFAPIVFSIAAIVGTLFGNRRYEARQKTLITSSSLPY